MTVSCAPGRSGRGHTRARRVSARAITAVRCPLNGEARPQPRGRALPPDRAALAGHLARSTNQLLGSIMTRPHRPVTPPTHNGTPCALCEGTRDVTHRTVLDVPLDICRWCWQRYGPPRHLRDDYRPGDPLETPFDGPAHQLADYLDTLDPAAEADRDAARAEIVRRNQEREDMR